MKKYFKLFTLLLCVFLIITCISISVLSAGAQETSKKYKIGYDIYWLGNTWSVMLAEEFKYAVERPEYKDIVEAVYTEAENDTNKMINNIEDLIAQKCDAIIVTPTSQTALNPVLRKAREAGIKVVLNATRADDPEAYDALVYYDNYLIAKQRMEWMARKLNYKGKIIDVLGIAGYACTEDSIKGHQEVADKYKDIKIIGTINGMWSYATTKNEMANALTAYPQIDGVLNVNGAGGVGAIEAFEDAGRPLVPITGEDNNGFLRKWVWIREQQEAGNEFYYKFDSNAHAMPVYLSVTSLEVALKLLQGIPLEFEKDYQFPKAILEQGVGLICADELDKYVKPDLPDGINTLTTLSDEELREIFKQ